MLTRYRPFAVVLVAVGTAILPPVGDAWADHDPPIVVTPGDQDGRRSSPSIDIGVTDGGRPGQPGASRGGGKAPTSCRWAPAPDMEAWLRRLPRSLPAGGADRVDPRRHLFERLCGGVEAGFAWFGPAAGGVGAAPTPARLAAEAAGELRLPAPTPGRSPDLRFAGRAALLVGEHTWAWTDPAVFGPRGRTVRAGAVWARVTAHPVSLSFDPGTGQSPVACAGAGTPFDAGRYGAHAASPTCDVVLTRSSARFPGGTVAAIWAVRWRVSWVGRDAAGRAVSGVLADLTSRTAVVVAVVEAQALVTG